MVKIIKEYTKYLLLLDSLLLIVAMVSFVIRPHDLSPLVIGIISLLLGIDAVLYYVVFRVWESDRPILRIAVMGFLAANIILTITDQVGGVEFANIAVNGELLFVFALMKKKNG